MTHPRSSNIARLLRDDVSAVVEQWCDVVTTRLPPARAMSEASLRDGMRDLLAAVADELDVSTQASVPGDASADATSIRDSGLQATARRHAASRVQAGFTLEHLVAEYRALRAAVLRRMAGSSEASSYSLDEVLRFDDAIDEALETTAVFHVRRVGRARELFAGVLGRDLRDPLDAIKASAEQLLGLDGLVPEGAKAGREVLDGAARMARMMDDLLDVARAGAGTGLPLDPERVDFADICRQAVAESSAAHPLSRLVLDIPTSLIGKWDSARLGQLVGSLVANAVAYGVAGRPIELALRDDGDGNAVLVVRNDGGDIDPRELDGLFDPLSRTPSGARPAGAGAGLGLSMAKAIAAAHRGTISVESSVVDGTSFTVVLPRHW